MEKFSILSFTRLCELNIEKKYVSECLDYVKRADFSYHPGIIMPYDSTLSLYKLRLNIIKEKGIVDPGHIADFEEVIKNMEQIRPESIGIAGLFNHEYTYMIFFEPKDWLIVGVLKGLNHKQSSE